MAEKIKVFFSQRMRGKTEKEIRREREEFEKYVEEQGLNYRIINELNFKPYVSESDALRLLGDSIKTLSEADIAVFVAGCTDTSRGCIIEDQCCNSYGIPKVTWCSPEKSLSPDV